MKATTDQLTVRVKLHFMLCEVDGQDRFQVHALQDGQAELLDVTDQYTVTSANNPETGQSGFVVMKNKECES